jgi:murein DD-endopeptidase MepM/ murein hydrolase activator NlpD
VTAAYGIPGDWIAGHHTGIDLALPVGTPVRSVGSGRVALAGWGGDYGLRVMVRMDDGHHTLFAHLSDVEVRPGARVGYGTLVGFSGNTGRSSGPHLHFEVRRTPDYGSDIDPVPYLASKGVRL